MDSPSATAVIVLLRLARNCTNLETGENRVVDGTAARLRAVICRATPLGVRWSLVDVCGSVVVQFSHPLSGLQASPTISAAPIFLP
jgi:hypothetical protein